MKNNMSWFDRIVRFALSALLITLYFMGGVTGILGTVLIVLAGILLITAIVGVCPLYMLLHIDSRSSTW